MRKVELLPTPDCEAGYGPAMPKFAHPQKKNRLYDYYK